MNPCAIAVTACVVCPFGEVTKYFGKRKNHSLFAVPTNDKKRTLVEITAMCASKIFVDCGHFNFNVH